MIFKTKTKILSELDKSVMNRLDARVTEGKVKGFRFDLYLLEALKEGATIELARLPLTADLIGVIFENNFEGVKYSIGVTCDTSDTLGVSNKERFASFIAPLEADKASVYLTVLKGEILVGDSLNGLVQFIGA